MTDRRIPALDGYRALAALGIVAFHVLGFNVILQGHGGFWETLAGGTIGNVLDAFFIISGFALFYRVILAEGELESAGEFYRRRAVRIYPAYWLMLCVLLVLMSIHVPSNFASFPPSALEAVVQFSGFQKLAQIFDSNLLIGFGINGVTWFVTVILCLYAVFPLIARPYYRHPFIGLAVAALVSIAWKQAIAHVPGVFNAIQMHDTFFNTGAAIDQFPGFAFSFGVGMTAAWTYHRLTATRPRLELERAALWLSPLALAGLAVAIYLLGDRVAHVLGALSPTLARGSAFIPIVWSAAVAFAMLVVLLGPGWMRRPFESMPARWLSDLSYAIFLIQAVVIVYLADLFPAWALSKDWLDVTLLFLAVLAISILYAMASRRFVELPAREWAARRERRRKDRRAETSPRETAPSAPPERQPSALGPS